MLWEEARRRGIEMQNMRFLGRPTDIFRYKKNNHWEYFNGLPRVGRDNPALAWIDDKAILKKRLLHAGVPVPAGGSFSNFPDMAKAFENLQKPVIVKPRLGSRGRHTTTHIYTPEELRHAYVVGKELCYYVIMEEHIVGSVYRGTVIDGKLAGVLAGEPPKIIGDGMHTIVELARMKNDSRDSRIKDVLINHMMQDFLARQGYSFDAVLPAGITIDLSEKIGTSYGGKSIEVTDETHPKIKQALEAAARAIGDPILGFDFIIADVTADPDDIKWGIIECNAVPFIQLHHEPLEGTPQNVAGKIWEYVFKND